MQEKAVLVGLITPDVNKEKILLFLKELSFLTRTAGAKPIKQFLQKLPFPNPKTFIGKGKIEEVYSFCKANKPDMIIFDDELSSTQIRNLERIFSCKILDRSNLILDIFASRARTATARTQVELAQYQYLLPRLTRMWTHLERQKGGIGMRGPGETQIETDRRIIKSKISLLKNKIQKIQKQSMTQRKRRGALIRVALIGYTNVGKSTLMNRISKSDIFAENKLFATLDTTVRKVVIKNLAFLLSDTVGFIRKLPHQLIESFKSTLDEAKESDLLVHVIDISSPSFEEHMQVVNKTMLEIESTDKPVIYVFNKIDLFNETNNNTCLKELKKTWMSTIGKNVVFISALNQYSINSLQEIIYKKVKELHIKRYPYNDFLF